jgi:hypothetical protein
LLRIVAGDIPVVAATDHVRWSRRGVRQKRTAARIEITSTSNVNNSIDSSPVEDNAVPSNKRQKRDNNHDKDFWGEEDEEDSVESEEASVDDDNEDNSDEIVHGKNKL